MMNGQFLIWVCRPLMWNGPFLFGVGPSPIRNSSFLIRVSLSQMRKSRFLIRVWLRGCFEFCVSAGSRRIEDEWHRRNTWRSPDRSSAGSPEVSPNLDALTLPSPRGRVISRSSRPTRGGIPTGGVGQLFEVGACDEWLSQILRVIDDGLHNEPGIAVWLSDAIKVFRYDRVCAIRNAIPSQISSARTR